MEYLTILLVVIGLLAIAVLGLAVQVIFKKDHRFPDTHVGHNKNMKKLGITCATSMDKIEQSKAKKELKFKSLSLLER
jgi:hypothetical protein